MKEMTALEMEMVEGGIRWKCVTAFALYGISLAMLSGITLTSAGTLTGPGVAALASYGGSIISVIQSCI